MREGDSLCVLNREQRVLIKRRAPFVPLTATTNSVHSVHPPSHCCLSGDGPARNPTNKPPTHMRRLRSMVRSGHLGLRGNLQIKFISLSDSPRSTTTNPVQG